MRSGLQAAAWHARPLEAEARNGLSERAVDGAKVLTAINDPWPPGRGRSMPRGMRASPPFGPRRKGAKIGRGGGLPDRKPPGVWDTAILHT